MARELGVVRSNPDAPPTRRRDRATAQSGAHRSAVRMIAFLSFAGSRHAIALATNQHSDGAGAGLCFATHRAVTACCCFARVR